MVRIYPFRGILYNKDRLKVFSKVFAPPYDIISPEEQDELYNIHDFNFVRLILGKEFPGDSEYNNRYVRSAAFLDGWLRHKIMVQDNKPAFYIYEQVFSVGGKRYSRVGFIGILRLEDMGRGKVFPHEETYPKAKMDRLQLMRATSADLDCIFSLYSDEKDKVLRTLKKFMRRKPGIDVIDKYRGGHRLWKIDTKSGIDKIVKEMKDKAVFIADGHHRYEAALRFKTELKMKNTKFSEEEPYNHIMMYFNSIEDEGLVVLPIHRVIHHLAIFGQEKFLKDLEEYFEVTAYKASKKTDPVIRKKLLRDLAKKGLTQHVFGLYLGNHLYYLLTLKDEKILDELVEEEKPKAWKRLDVTILHYIVFDRIMGIAQETGEKVIYTKDADEAVKLVDDKIAQISFLLNPTKIEEIVSIASKLEKLPHKSTYFYPKLLSGLVLYKIVHGEKVKL